jgi:thiol:disulfide interchange protein
MGCRMALGCGSPFNVLGRVSGKIFPCSGALKWTGRCLTGYTCFLLARFFVFSTFRY